MVNRLTGKVNDISFIKNIDTNLDLCSMTIDFDEVKIFYDHSDLIPFLHEEVIYTIRPDVIDGRPETVICELAKLSTIQTVQSIENVKLVPEGNKRTVCNFSIKDIQFGSFNPGCVAYLSGFELGSSKKAKWFDCTLIDRESKEFSLRLFQSKGDYEHTEDVFSTFVNHYVQFDLESTKYGFQASEINVLTNDVELSPEVEVARSIYLSEIEKDEALKKYEESYHLMDNLLSYIDGEPGYMLVRIVSEIYMINAIDNISCDLDIKAMKRAAVCSRGYCLPHSAKWSKPMLNTNKAMKVPELRSDRELMCILDVLTDEQVSSTKATYIKVRGLVEDIIKIRRGIIYEKGNNNFDDLMSAFNGLL